MAKRLGFVTLLFLAALLGARLHVSFEPPPSARSEAPRAIDVSEEFVRIGEQMQPAVVSIDALKVIPGYQQPVIDPFFPFSPGQIFQSPDQKVPSVGSGLIVRADGYIVTNHHVVDGVQQIQITFSNNKVAPAKLIGSDPASDLAVLKVDRQGLTVPPWGESHRLRVGEWVLAFGSPYRMRGSMSHGIVSALGRKDLGLADLEDYVQTDAAVNPGNSGGPLVNMKGEVVGINSAILSKSGGSHGISLSIPTETVRPVIEELIAKGRVERSWLGLFVQNVDDGVAQQLRLPSVAGALVVGGYNDGPAAKGGFQSGDVILAYNGTKVASDAQLRSQVAQTPVGKEVEFSVWRQGQLIELKAKTMARGLDAQNQPVKGI